MGKASIEAINLSKYYGSLSILDNISFRLNTGEKVGLVGLNGCGKTTLLRIMAGEEEPGGGTVIITGSQGRAGHLPQWITLGEESAREFLERACRRSGLNDQWEKRRAVEQALHEVGLDIALLKTPSGNLSGGERTRLFCAALLIEKPEFILLDEPTNFLDFEGIEWVESFIRSRPEGMLIVSHDRYLLDSVTTRTLEIEKAALSDYGGPYSFYRREKELQISTRQKEHRAQQAEVQRLSRLAAAHREKGNKVERSTVNDFLRGRATRHSKTAKALEKRMERIDKVDKPWEFDRISIRLKGARSSAIVAQCDDLAKSFNGRSLFRDVRFTVRAGERVGLLGPNGSGKTTLLRILLGEEQADGGTVYSIDRKRIGYLSQLCGEMECNATVLEHFMKSMSLNRWEAQQILAFYLFRGSDVDKKISSLSAGERSRLAMASLNNSEIDALICDEPTNYLDAWTAEMFESAIKNFEGALILVTHDRYMLDSLVERILAIEDGAVRDYPGNYSYYLDHRRV